MIGCNIDVFIAGCSTNCKHCYVDGGPKQATAMDQIIYTMERFEVLLTKFKEIGLEVSVTLDNEPMNHKRAKEIYDLTKKHLGDYYFHHGSTTGIPLLNHGNQELICETMIKHGYKEVGLTLHGDHEHHNDIVRNPKGLNALIEAGKYLYHKDFDVVVSFMLSKVLIQDRKQVSKIINEIPHNGVYFAITNASPVKRIQDYQSYRASLDDVYKLKGYLNEWGFDEDRLFQRFQVSHEDYYIDQLSQLSSWMQLDGSASYMYMSLDQDLNLYYGNTGLELLKIGNLRTLTDEEILEAVDALSPNDCYWDTYFKTESLPNIKDFIAMVNKERVENHIYPNMDSFLTYWFKKFNFDTIRIND